MTAIKSNNLTRIIHWIGKGDERSILFDNLEQLETIPDLMNFFLGDKTIIQIEETYREIIEDLVPGLSNREKECFFLHVIHQKSMKDTDHILGISKSSVQKYINRVRGKIDAAVTSGYNSN
ncbi:sigma factor-like helix-turn-helix DNA-binding protein [Pseudogracilibacillus sp. SO30301A]|uniref:sigma factor-like helix-turn-helix DNA-binding protein n=1 Tax=Pseudogracilibacillus sp. SO30301A TaxID=3098291 RepID=UPI00300DD7D8